MICKLKEKKFDGILNKYIYTDFFGLPHKSERIGDMGKSLNGKESGRKHNGKL